MRFISRRRARVLSAFPLSPKRDLESAQVMGGITVRRRGPKRIGYDGMRGSWLEIDYERLSACQADAKAYLYSFWNANPSSSMKAANERACAHRRGT